VNGTGGWDTQLIEGDPIQVGSHELVPVVKRRSALRRQVTFGTHNSNGGGGGVVWLQPAHLVVRRPDGSTEQMPVFDATGETIQKMLMGALMLPIIYLVVAILMFAWRRRERSAERRRRERSAERRRRRPRPTHRR